MKQPPSIPSLENDRPQSPTAFRLTPMNLPVDNSRAAPQCRQSPRQSPSTVITDLSALESPRFVGSYYETSSPQGNSSTSPRGTATNRKAKSEMCMNLLTKGYCRFGSECLFAHSEDERMKFSSVEEMYQHGLITNKADVGVYLNRPCCFWVRSGSCPYNSRCKSLHDPRLQTANATPSWLEHKCKHIKKDPTLILDRLHHVRLNGVIQVNPLVEPWTWNECRPNTAAAADNDDESVWVDTYRLVCNWEVPIFSSQDVPRKEEKGSVMSYSNMVSRTYHEKVSDLQKLCIVAAMKKPSKIGSTGMGAHDASMDFTYEPTHCLNGQPCMILQARFFRLLDYKQKTHVSSIEDVVEEISMQEYQRLANNLTTRVYEAVMDSKGKRSANLSIFFDVDVTSCSNNKAKRVSKKGEENWQLEDKTLFCLPKNDAFVSCLPQTKPYIMMQPVDDTQAGHALIDGIIEHRIATLLHKQGCQFGKLLNKDSLDVREEELKSKLFCMMDVLSRDFWPATSTMDHIKKKTEERNQTEYHPAEDEGSRNSSTLLWNSFVLNLSATADEVEHSSSRLSVLQSMEAKQDTNTNLPHLKKKKPAPVPVYRSTNQHLSEATWKELLEGQTGAWAAAQYTYHMKNVHHL